MSIHLPRQICLTLSTCFLFSLQFRLHFRLGKLFFRTYRTSLPCLALPPCFCARGSMSMHPPRRIAKLRYTIPASNSLAFQAGQDRHGRRHEQEGWRKVRREGVPHPQDLPQRGGFRLLGAPRRGGYRGVRQDREGEGG